MWYLYIVRCKDGTLYTGVTTDVERRFAEHQNGGPKAARYLKGRGPLQLVYRTKAGARRTALKLEHRIKGLSKVQKEKFIKHPETRRRLIGTLKKTVENTNG